MLFSNKLSAINRVRARCTLYIVNLHSFIRCGKQKIEMKTPGDIKKINTFDPSDDATIKLYSLDQTSWTHRQLGGVVKIIFIPQAS